MLTAEKVYRDLVKMPVAERERLFALIGKRGFEKDHYTHEEVFGELLGSHFTSQEAAAFLEVSASQIRQWVRDGSLKPSGKIGKTPVFPFSRLSSFKRNLLNTKGR